MKIFIAADHRGVGLKLYLIEMLSTAGYAVVNLGTDDPNTMVDYPEIAQLVTDKLLDDKNARGIIVCGSGGGACIAANRFSHIRAAVCNRPETARENREHNDINVICLGADHIDIEAAFITTEAFLTTQFDAAERRVRRIKMMS